MKRILVFSLLSCTILAACTPSRTRTVYTNAPFPRPDGPNGPEGYPNGPVEGMPGTGTEGAPTPAPTPAAKPTPTPGVAAPTPAAKREVLYGIKEPGKPGFMRSPYHPEAGLLDYRGLAPGSEVKDYYTPGKTLLVP